MPPLITVIMPPDYTSSLQVTTAILSLTSSCLHDTRPTDARTPPPMQEGQSALPPPANQHGGEPQYISTGGQSEGWSTGVRQQQQQQLDRRAPGCQQPRHLATDAVPVMLRSQTVVHDPHCLLPHAHQPHLQILPLPPLPFFLLWASFLKSVFLHEVQ